MNQILYPNKNKRRAQKLMSLLCSLFAFLILVLVVFAIINSRNEKILKGVFVRGIDVGNLTKEEAYEKVNQGISDVRAKDIKLELDGEEYLYKGADFGVIVSEDALSKAHEYGRDGNIITNTFTALTSYLGKKYEINEMIEIEDARIDSKLLEIESAKNNVAVDDSYEIKEDKVLVAKGHDGVTIKKDELRDEIKQALLEDENIQIKIPVEIREASRISLDRLYDEVYVEKVDASYTSGENFEVIREVTGISFDKELAKQKYDETKDDETLEIALIKTAPEKTTADLDKVLFKDVLGEFTTKYDASYTNRVTNMQIAANHINGTILYPGEEFSYNKVVGERTAARGFKDAHVYAGGKVVDGLGGGICQVSSTLYNAALLANLEITNRVAHMMHTGYVEPSFDATVVYGSIDFKFKNNRETPIKIVATLNKGVETVKIYGLKSENDLKVELKSVVISKTNYKTITEYDKTMPEGTSKVTQSPMMGYVSEGYKILKDANGKEVSKTLLSKDTYKPTDKIVVVGTKVVETSKPSVPETPEQGNNNNNNSGTQKPGTDLPSGWDTPENPYYQGNN